jgi:hypothetical protein
VTVMPDEARFLWARFSANYVMGIEWALTPFLDIQTSRFKVN